jgi:hypothetical protein
MAPLLFQLLEQPPVPLVLQNVFVPGLKTSEGQLIEAVMLPWSEIIAAIG